MTMPGELRYLESEAAIKERLFMISGRRPNSRNAAFVSSCLLHGRLFWESAESAPLETRPLILYYGAASFAKALVVAYNSCDLSEVAKHHGLSCTQGDGDLIANFTITAKGQGLFQQFNDVASTLNRFEYYDEGSNRQVIQNPTAKSDRLGQLRLTIEQALSRQPSLSADYARCTGKTPNTIGFIFHTSIHGPGLYEIRVDDHQTYSSIDELKALVARIRDRAPFLKQWRIIRASVAWNSSIINFANLRVPADEFTELEEHQSGSRISFVLSDRIQSDTSLHFMGLNALAPFAQPPGGYPAYVAPVDGGEYISIYSLMMLALLGLSSLVRYEPHTWTSCLHRRPFAGRTVDDALLPVIEQFLNLAMGTMPAFVVNALILDRVGS